MKAPKDKHFRRIFNDWTFMGAVVVSVALVVSIAMGRLQTSNTVIGALLAFWVVAVVLLYARVLEVLEESKNSRFAMLNEIKTLQIDSRNAIAIQKLPVISMEAFAQLEAQLTEGDSVLVFANTLELDCQPMFDAVASNLTKGVNYKYILFKDEQIDNWEKFVRILKRNGITNLPEAVFETSKIANLLRSSTAIYDYQDNGRVPDGFCVLETSHQFDTCVMLSPTVARQTRDAFNKVWRVISEESAVGNALVDRDTRPKLLFPASQDSIVDARVNSSGPTESQAPIETPEGSK